MHALRKTAESIGNKVRNVCGKVKALPMVAGAGLVVANQAVYAQTGTDTTAITGAFADATTGVGAIAAVMLGVVAAGIAVKWILGFLLG